MIKFLRIVSKFSNKSSSAQGYQKIVDLQNKKGQMLNNYSLKLKECTDYDQARQLSLKYEKELEKLEVEQFFLSKKLKDIQKQELKDQLMEERINLDELEKQELEKEKQQEAVLKEKKQQQSIKQQQQKLKSQQSQQQQSQSQGKIDKINVPRGLEIRILKSPLNNNGQIIMLGVQQTNLVHAQFVYDALVSLKPEIILTQLQPDIPFFIKSEDNFDLSWRRYIEEKMDYNFHTNPNPKLLQDILLNDQKVEWIMRNNIIKQSRFVVNPICIMEAVKFNGIQLNIIDVMKTPLLFSYHHKTPIIVGGYPEILYRYYLATNSTEEELKSLLQQKQDALAKKQRNFDPLLLNPDLFIKPKIQYETEILKMSLFFNKQCVALVDVHSVNQIEEEWQNIDHTQICKDLRQFHKNELVSPKDFHSFMRKLILLDLLISPFISDNFIQYYSFPYQFESSNTISLVQAWNHIKYDYQNGKFNSINM